MASTFLVEPEIAVELRTPFSKGREHAVHALVLDEDPEVLEYLTNMLVRQTCRVSAFRTIPDALAELDRGLRPNIALINAQMTNASGDPALALFRQINPRVPAIALSCSYDPKAIVQAMKMGAADVLLQPFDSWELKASLGRCIALPLVGSEQSAQEIELSPNSWFVFSSARMNAIAHQCASIARADIPVLILGESGTGKEILAHFIHKMSSCSNRTFLKVNCAAMPPDLLESELLGYEQGAFTGAVKSKPGKFELCDHGTILLDEIGEMPPALQAKLLQVLQDGTFSRLGGRSTIKVDVRVIASTNVDIAAAIAEHRFREDLYYRLNGFSLSLPPLRERKEEIPVLIRHFVRKLADKYGREPIILSEELMEKCVRYSWPGNLRELENFVKRFLVLGDERAMLAELSCGKPVMGVNLSDRCISTKAGGLKKMVSYLKGEAEAVAIRQVLDRSHWNRKQAAAELKISYKALLYKMRQYGIMDRHVEVA